MKVFIALCCLIVCAQASYSPAVVSSKVINTGTSTQTRSQDAAGNYAFSYNEQHATGGSSRKEQGDAWNNVQGSYSLNVGDGRQRVVKYVADGHGFRASIKTNEPGIVAKAPADVSISTPHGSAYGSSGYGHGDAYGHGNVYGHDLKGDYSHGYENSYAPAHYGHDNYYGAAKVVVGGYGHGYGNEYKNYGLGHGYGYGHNNYGHNNYGHNNYGHNYGHSNYAHGYDNHYPSTTTLVGGYTQALKGDHGYGNHHNYANTYDGHYGSHY